MEYYARHEIILFLVVTTVVITGLIVFLVFLIRMFLNRKYKEEMKISELRVAHAEAVAASKVEIQESTFENISREIHDNIKQSLTFSMLSLENLFNGKSRDMKEVDTAIKWMTKAINDLSNLSLSLDADQIRKDGLQNVLEKEIEKLKESGKCHIETIITGNEILLDPEKELVVFRIIQESITNAIRHGKAKKITIGFDYQSDDLVIIVIDDGKGFSYPIPGGTKGNGLKNITARARVLKGAVKIMTEPGKGATVAVSVPYIDWSITKPLYATKS